MESITNARLQVQAKDQAKHRHAEEQDYRLVGILQPKREYDHELGPARDGK